MKFSNILEWLTYQNKYICNDKTHPLSIESKLDFNQNFPIIFEWHCLVVLVWITIFEKKCDFNHNFQILFIFSFFYILIHDFYDPKTEVELNKLDERLVQILAWQRLQQLLPQKAAPGPAKKGIINGLLAQSGMCQGV